MDMSAMEKLRLELEYKMLLAIKDLIDGKEPQKIMATYKFYDHSIKTGAKVPWDGKLIFECRTDDISIAYDLFKAEVGVYPEKLRSVSCDIEDDK